MCQKAFGNFGAALVSVPAASVAWTRGSPAQFRSSAIVARGFCDRCGSPIFFESARWPDETHVARALFIDELDREPSAHVFFESHVPWLELGDELPKKVSQAALVVSPATAAPASSSDGPN